MNQTVLIADDHSILREGLRSLLESEEGIDVIAMADNGRTAVELTIKYDPDVVIMDVAMPDLNGIEATRQITKECPRTKVLALSTHSSRHYVNEMMRAGAVAYIVKECTPDELIFAIKAVLNEQSYLCPKVANIILADYRQQCNNREAVTVSSPLTSREREVLQLLAEGNTVKEIAGKLFIAEKTVETHRKQIMDKLNLRNIASLTKYAITEGLTSVDL
ncbi:MAG: response regulator transcription factor [Armatimonadota bacterium]